MLSDAVGQRKKGIGEVGQHLDNRLNALWWQRMSSGGPRRPSGELDDKPLDNQSAEWDEDQRTWPNAVVELRRDGIGKGMAEMTRDDDFRIGHTEREKL